MSVMRPRNLTCAIGFGPVVEGEAIVSTQGFNSRYDLDRLKGVFCRPDHDHYGVSPAGKIFVFSAPKGGIATSWALLDLRQRQLAPIALVCRRANPVVAQGAVLSGIPLMDRFELDPIEHLRTGDRLRLSPHLGLIEIL